MNQSAPLLTSNSAILWLKVLLTALSLLLIYLRYQRRSSGGPATATPSLRAKVLLVAAVVFAFGVYHNLGHPRSGTFLHYGEMFHYYMGPKYFKEVGYYDLYNATIVADSEQDNALKGLPFYTDLTTYKNLHREAALRDASRIKGLFSAQRWDAFKQDIAFFKQETGMPRLPVLYFFLMDHGYNASPVSTFVLGTLVNLVPVTQLKLLAAFDVLLVAAMLGMVFRTFGYETGALFGIYFCVNILNDNGYVSGSILRYDWLLYLVAAVCLLEKRHYASCAFFLTLSGMIRVFPLVLFFGIGVVLFKRLKTARAVDRESRRFVLSAAVTALALFLLPAIYPGSVLQPWKDFASKTALHDDGVYVNHLGLRGLVLFEPSQLSFDAFVKRFSSASTSDVVRHWQDAKEVEYRQKKPLVLLGALLVLAGLTAILWKRPEAESESGSLVWPLLLVYALSYPSHYYYAFLCLFVLLFSKRASARSEFVPLCLLFAFNILTLVTDFCRPSPIVFYTLANIYLFVCVAAIIGYELYLNVFGSQAPQAAAASRSGPVKRSRSKKSQRASRRAWT